MLSEQIRIPQHDSQMSHETWMNRKDGKTYGFYLHRRTGNGQRACGNICKELCCTVIRADGYRQYDAASYC